MSYMPPRPISSALAGALLIATACVGTLEPTDPQGTPGGSTADAAPDSCIPAQATQEDGHHNPGLACMTCHDGTDPAAPIYSFAGTLYTDLVGTAPVSGGTIRVIDANNVTVDVVTALNGNFWSTTPVVYPVKTEASRCPDTIPMVAPVQESGADCNSGGCHDGDYRAYLP